MHRCTRAGRNDRNRDLDDAMDRSRTEKEAAHDAVSSAGAVRACCGTDASPTDVTAKDLTEACRKGDAAAVHKLLEQGASFRKVINAYDPALIKSQLAVRYPPRHVPDSAWSEILDLLEQYGEPNPAIGLFWAILTRQFPLAEELLRRGAALLERQRAVIVGSVPVAATPTVLDQNAFAVAVQCADNTELQEMIRLLRRCTDGDKVTVGIRPIEMHFGGRRGEEARCEPRLIKRFRDPEMLKYLLENTTLAKAVPRSALICAVVDEGSADGLEWLVQHGFVQLPDDLETIFTSIYSVPEPRPALCALALAYCREYGPADDLPTLQ